jgi:hypothetical protein
VHAAPNRALTRNVPPRSHAFHLKFGDTQQDLHDQAAGFRARVKPVVHAVERSAGGSDSLDMSESIG